MQIDSVFYVRTALCGLALYICLAQWIYCCRLQVCRERRNSKELRMAIIVGSASTTAFITMTLETSRIYMQYSIADDILAYASTTLYALSLMLMYTIIWLRQRTFYTNPALLELTNKCTRITSKFVLVGIISVASILCVVLSLVATVGDCDEKCYEGLYYVTLLVAPCFAQSILLSLFLHPLRKYHKTNMITDPRYVVLMKRIAILTGVCLVSDLISVLIEIYVIDFLALQVNLILNLVCIILATTNWRSRCLPCLKSLE